MVYHHRGMPRASCLTIGFQKLSLWIINTPFRSDAAPMWSIMATEVSFRAKGSDRVLLGPRLGHFGVWRPSNSGKMSRGNPKIEHGHQNPDDKVQNLSESLRIPRLTSLGHFMRRVRIFAPSSCESQVSFSTRPMKLTCALAQLAPQCEANILDSTHNGNAIFKGHD